MIGETIDRHRVVWVYSLSVGPHRLAFNAAELTGSVLMAQRPPE